MKYPLYEDIALVEDDDFPAFLEHWKEKNNDQYLDASRRDRERAAYQEMSYLVRGAESDDQRYRDVIVSEDIGGPIGCGVVDVKVTYVKVSRERLFPHLKATVLSNVRKFKETGIEKVHYWTENTREGHLQFWFIFDVRTKTFHFSP